MAPSPPTSPPATEPDDAASPKAGRRGKGLLLVAVALLIVLLGMLGGAYAMVDSSLDRISYNARLVGVRPSNGCVAFAKGMDGLVDHFSKLAGKLPFEIVLDPPTSPPTSPPTPKPDVGGPPDVGNALGDADPSLERADDADAGDDAPRADAGAGDDPGEDTPDQADDDEDDEDDDDDFEGSDCSAIVEVEVEVENPLPIAAVMQITHVDGVLSGEMVEPDQIQFDTEPIKVDGYATVTRVITLHFNLAQIVSAGGILLMRNSVPVEANARVNVKTLFGILERNIKLRLERRLTRQEIVEGIAGTVAAEETEDDDEGEAEPSEDEE